MNNFKTKYDVVLVGGGIANISLALNLINTDINVLLIELGKDLKNRRCPKEKVGKCVNCNPCAITSGFSGAGCFSDCKLTYSSEVGGTLIDYVGKEKFADLLNKADAMFVQHGAKEPVVYGGDFADKLAYDCQKYGMKLVKGAVRHLGTDGSYDVMLNIREKLETAPNVDILCNSEVKQIDFKNQVAVLNNETQFEYDQLCIAVGRSGSSWLRSQCISNDIKMINSSVDIGVRVECPRSITDEVTDQLYEFKIVNYSSSDNKVRTFCVNPGGYVVQENYDDCVCVNGHSLSDNKCLNTNFALLVSCNFTDPFNEPIRYGKSICKLSNMLADGKVMVQRLVDLKNKKRSTKSRIARLSIEPTLTDAEPGDLRYVFPANVIDSIVETLDNLNNVMPGINGVNTILYSPEVKFYSSKIELNSKLQNSKFDNVYFIGDSSGVTHGIMQSVMSGIYVAEDLKGKLLGQ